MIFFRADGNAKIGSGHVMRCLSLADAFRKKGRDCTFLLADRNLKELIETRGHEAILLDSHFDDLEQELPALLALIGEKKPEFIVLDSYFVTPRYLHELKEKVRTVYFDDVYAFAYEVDCLINYNVYGTEALYAKAYETEGLALPRLFMGCSYAPLRKMFQDVPQREAKIIAKEILISTGGTDPFHISLGILKKIGDDPCFANLHFRFLVGAMNQDKEAIFERSEKLPNAEVIFQVSDMRSLLDASDLAISATGSTMYELCACGVPVITYAFADNQLPGAKRFGELGIATYCGDARTNESLIDDLLAALLSLAKDAEKRAFLTREMQKMVDGKGADRLAEAIIVSFV